jgi:hypothetical protein
MHGASLSASCHNTAVFAAAFAARTSPSADSRGVSCRGGAGAAGARPSCCPHLDAALHVFLIQNLRDVVSAAPRTAAEGGSTRSREDTSAPRAWTGGVQMAAPSRGGRGTPWCPVPHASAGVPKRCCLAIARVTGADGAGAAAAVMGSLAVLCTLHCIAAHSIALTTAPLSARFAFFPTCLRPAEHRPSGGLAKPVRWRKGHVL